MKKGAASSGSPVVNKWIQAGRTASGDPDVDAFNAAIVGLAREHQRVLTSPQSSAQLHASSADTADQLINKAKTPAQIMATIGVMRKEVQNAREQANETLGSLKSQISGLGPQQNRRAGDVPASNHPQDIQDLLKKYGR